MSAEELEPCPFCGRDARITTTDVEPQGDPWYSGKVETFVLCKCGACLFDGAFHEGFYDAETRAVAAWNHRAAEATSKQSLQVVPLLTDEQMPPLPIPASWYAGSFGAAYTDQQLRAHARAVEAAVRKQILGEAA